MEVPDKTWEHIKALVEGLETYNTYADYLDDSEAVINLLRATIADQERE